MEVVGRRAELEQVEQFLDPAVRGPQRLFVQGEPGVGKTTVWAAGIESARRRGHCVLVSRPAESESSLSYAGLADLLAELDEDAYAELPDPQRNALEVALVRRAPARTPLDQRAVFAGFRTVVERLAAERPVVIAVDDLQWLDSPSTRSLEYVLRRVTSAPVVFFAAARVGGEFETAWPSEQDRLRLRPLTAAALHKLIKIRLDVSLSRTTLLRLHEACGGNAFFALEITRVLAEQQTLEVHDAWPLTDDVRHVVGSYLESLPLSVRDALLIVSAASHPTRDLIDADALAAAEEAGLVRVDHTGRIRFVHPLYASAIYLGAAEETRRRVHAELAPAAEPLEQARHLALAAEGADEKVACALEQAALIAIARGAPETAAELQERAAELTPAALPANLAARRLSAAGLYLQAGDPAKAASLLGELAGGSEPELDAQALHLLALIRFREERFEEAVGLLHRTAGSTADPALRAAVELDLALVGIAVSFDHEPARAHAVAAVEHASRGNDDSLLASTLAVKTITEFLLGEGVDELQLARALELEEDNGRMRVEMRPTLIAGFIAFYTGRIDAARSLLYPLRDAMRERGEEAELPLLSIHLAWLECLVGNVEQARLLCDEALDLSALAQTMQAHAHAFAAVLEAQLGNAAQCREQVAAAFAASGAADYCLVVQWVSIATGLLELSLGNMADADRALERLASYFEERETVEPVHLATLPDKIEALVALGSLERAERLTELLRASGERFQRPPTLAAAERCRAVVLAGQRDLTSAQASVERALAQHELAPLPLEVARTLIIKGQLERRRKQRSAAAASLQQALSICEQIGASLWAQQARAELARTGTVRNQGELTPSEARVAELAAAGLMNREIAAAAFLSQKTVEANLSRIYRKLGIRSRAELGLRLAADERSLVEPGAR